MAKNSNASVPSSQLYQLYQSVMVAQNLQPLLQPQIANYIKHLFDNVKHKEMRQKQDLKKKALYIKVFVYLLIQLTIP